MLPCDSTLKISSRNGFPKTFFGEKRIMSVTYVKFVKLPYKVSDETGGKIAEQTCFYGFRVVFNGESDGAIFR